MFQDFQDVEKAEKGKRVINSGSYLVANMIKDFFSVIAARLY